MIKQLTGLTASFAALASVASAEVKIDDYLSLDGYATGSAVVTEGTAAKDKQLLGGGRVWDSALFAVNGKYDNFTARVSLLALDKSDNGLEDDAGLLDAYVTYKEGSFAVTGGKFLGWLGFESFHTVNNAFATFSQVYYASPYSTGVKVEYLGDTVSTGIAVRDSQISTPTPPKFFRGDGEYSDDLGYEAYISYTGIKGLTLFGGAGYEDVDGGDQAYTYDFWANYAFTDKLSLAAEVASIEDVTNYSWLIQPTYAVSSSLSVSARVTGVDGDSISDAIAYGVASTYTLTKNFSIKGEITETDNKGAPDVFGYGIQGIFKF